MAMYVAADNVPALHTCGALFSLSKVSLLFIEKHQPITLFEVQSVQQ
jgi:hypothetical protein